MPGTAHRPTLDTQALSKAARTAQRRPITALLAEPKAALPRTALLRVARRADLRRTARRRVARRAGLHRTARRRVGRRAGLHRTVRRRVARRAGIRRTAAHRRVARRPELRHAARRRAVPGADPHPLAERALAALQRQGRPPRLAAEPALALRLAVERRDRPRRQPVRQPRRHALRLPPAAPIRRPRCLTRSSHSFDPNWESASAFSLFLVQTAALWPAACYRQALWPLKTRAARWAAAGWWPAPRMKVEYSHRSPPGRRL
jgi:hypothetical protein